MGSEDLKQTDSLATHENIEVSLVDDFEDCQNIDNTPITYTTTHGFKYYGKRSKRMYFVPETSTWVSASMLKRHLAQHLQMTPQEYYDKFLSAKDEKVCKWCGKPNNAFLSITTGYTNTCSTSCSRKYYMHAQGGKELRSISQKEVMSRPGQREKVAKQAKLSYEAIKEQVRMRQLEAMRKPEIREKISRNTRLAMQSTEIRKKISDGCKLSFIKGRIHNTKRFNYCTLTDLTRCFADFSMSKVKTTLTVKSSWEATLVKYFEASSNVKYAYECIKLQYTIDDKCRRYIPDFCVQTKTTTYIVEVKPIAFCCDYTHAKVDSAIQYCKQHGYVFVLVTEHKLFNKQILNRLFI